MSQVFPHRLFVNWTNPCVLMRTFTPSQRSIIPITQSNFPCPPLPTSRSRSHLYTFPRPPRPFKPVPRHHRLLYIRSRLLSTRKEIHVLWRVVCSGGSDPPSPFPPLSLLPFSRRWRYSFTHPGLVLLSPHHKLKSAGACGTTGESGLREFLMMRYLSMSG